MGRNTHIIADVRTLTETHKSAALQGPLCWSHTPRRAEKINTISPVQRKMTRVEQKSLEINITGYTYKVTVMDRCPRLFVFSLNNDHIRTTVLLSTGSEQQLVLSSYPLSSVCSLMTNLALVLSLTVCVCGICMGLFTQLH